MSYIKYPHSLSTSNLTHVDKSILLQLCQLCYTFARSHHDREFWCTDKNLAKLSRCSTFSIFRAKKKLSKLKLIEYSTGPGNKTYYKLIGLK